MNEKSDKKAFRTSSYKTIEQSKHGRWNEVQGGALAPLDFENFSKRTLFS